VVVIFKVNRGVMTAMVGFHHLGARKLQVIVQHAQALGVGQTEDYFKNTEMFDIHC